jgi:signal transduction histidine kinase
MNEFCCSLLDIERNHYIGKKCTSIFSHDDEKCCELKANNEKPVLSEHILRKSDGTELIVLKYSRPIERAGKKYYIESFTDITERKKMEESNVKLLDNLSSANKDLQDFAYIVSHDLKAPLRGISTISDWLYEDYTDKLDEDGREQLEMLKSRVENIHNLIDGILQYSRATREGLETHCINLNKLLAEIVELVDPPENIKVTVQSDLPDIYADKFRIQQLFQNLISNAVKYNDKENGQIEVGLQEGKDNIAFTFKDNGMGMNQEDTENIFKIFYTVSGDKNSKDSTGVGLSIVKKIVDLYGGKIRVNSEKGKGSEFIVKLPKTVLCSG